MNTINLMKQQFIECASGLGLGDLTKVKTGPDRVALINKCADGYCKATDNGDELKRSQYISALMLLFYGEISKIADKCKAVSEYEYDDFASKLYECIETAMQYRAWQDGSTTAEACIRKLIASRGAPAILYESNLDIRKANYNTCSLNATVSNDDDAEVSRLDLVEDESANKYKADLTVQLMIQSVLDKGDVISSIVLDNIAFGDSTREVKESRIGTDYDEEGNETHFKYSVGHVEFSEHYLVKALTSLDEEYINYFINKYSVQEAAVEAAINRIRTVNNTKLYQMIRKVLNAQKALMQNWIVEA